MTELLVIFVLIFAVNQLSSYVSQVTAGRIWDDAVYFISSRRLFSAALTGTDTVDEDV